MPSLKLCDGRSMNNDDQILIFHEGDLVCDMRLQPGYLHRALHIEPELLDPSSRQEVGEYDGRRVSAYHTAKGTQLDPMRFMPTNLYRILPQAPAPDRDIISRGAHLAHWRHTHRFCGVCGSRNSVHPTEPGLQCEGCGFTSYPRVSPCGIVLMVDGDRMLLARNARFPRPMFSTLAGFVEAGESAEQTIAREIFEEVGLVSGKLHYFDSQAWPFPDQLMLGYFAQYAGGEIQVDGVEIAEAQWFDYRELPNNIPPTMSIAGRLIQHYCESRHQGINLFE